MPELVSGDLWVPDSARYQPERAHGGRPGNEVAVYDSTGVVVMNHTDQSTDYLMGEVARQSPEIASLVQWTRGVRSRHGSILDRDRYVTPTFVWDVFRAADYAVKNDDVVGGVYETTEALAFSKITVETDDDDECVDPETEILTIDGWKTHDQLHVGDLILTLNRETGFSEWKPVDFVFRKAYRGPMHSFQGRNFDALTTPEHRWYVKGTRGQQLRVVYSKDLNSGHRVPYARPCVNAPDCDPGISDDLVRVAGWLVTDGWYQPRHHHQWWISQSATANAANCLLIERALDALGAEWVLERTSADGVRHYKCGGAPADTLHKLLPDALLTMDFVRVLSPEQRYLLMETMIAGDGNAKGSSCSFTTTDAQQAEAFEFLVAQCGRATTRTIIPPGKVSFIGGRTVTSRRPKYVIHVMANRHAKVECLTHEIVEYDGVIWCPHTENGSFLARRNGHIYFTGNTDIWNQILGDIDLDARIREMWLAMYTFSQFYCASYWGQKTYKVESRIQAADEKDKNRRARRKTYDLKVPLGLSILDPTKVVPVGNLLFNQDQLAYAAMVPEIDVINATINGLRDSDPIIRQLLVAPWEPDIVERTQLGHMGLPADRLYLMNPNRVFRHTDTRLQYDRFAPVRLQAVFELLDMKAQLRQMDRAVLLASPLRGDQRCPTPEGMREIRSLEVGDRVFGVDGRPTAVRAVVPMGEREMFRLTFSDGAQVVCTGDHPWYVSRPDDRSKQRPGRILRTSEIIAEGLKTDSARGKNGYWRHQVPMVGPLEMPDADLPLHPYLLGYMLGDGSLNQSIPKITVAAGEEHPWEDVLPEGVTVTQYEHRPGYAEQYGLKGAKWYRGGNVVMNAIRDLRLDGTTSDTKFIPESYLLGSRSQRFALLQGLADSDGTPNGCNVDLTTVSEKMADGVIRLAQSLGGVASCKLCPPSPGTKNVLPFYRLHISVPTQEAPFRLQRKQAKWHPRRWPYVRSIVAIEPCGSAEAVCIKVDADDGLFATEGHVVTHNTNFLVVVKRGSKEQPATPGEIADTDSKFRTMARVPVIVADHRFEVEIVTPKNDQTLNPDRYDNIDNRITIRLLSLFITNKQQAAARSDDSIKLARVIGRSLESKRYMLRRAIERRVLHPIWEANEMLREKPRLRFHPQHIALDLDPALLNFILDMRDRGDVSRGTMLEQIDLDEEAEARKVEREHEIYDDIFQTVIPGAALPQNTGGQQEPPGAGNTSQPSRSGKLAQHRAEPKKPGQLVQAPTDPKAAGRRQGGAKNGGGVGRRGRGAGPNAKEGGSEDSEA